MIRFLFLSIIILASSVCNAQKKPVKSIEAEFDIGISLPLEKYHSGDALVGPSLAANLRYNLKDSPWDCGLLFQIDGARRDFWHDKSNDNWQTNRTTVFALTGGYNFRQGQKVNPYMNLALGVGLNQVVGDKFIDINATSPVIMPKIGVELWHNLRINTHVLFSRKGFNRLRRSLRCY
jgi:hypothetical protein